MHLSSNRTTIASIASIATLAIGMTFARPPEPLGAQSATLTIAGYSGSFEKGLEAQAIPAFESQCGCHVTYIPGPSTDTIAKLQAQRDHPEIDVAIVDEGPQAQAADFGLFEPIDRGEIKNYRSLYPIAHLPHDLGVAIGLIATGIAYNTKTFSDNHWAPMRSWHDLDRPELAGKLVLPSITNTYGLQLLVMEARIHGGSETNIDPGFAAMKKLAAATVTFDKTADVSNYFLQGTAVASVWGNSRTNTLRNQSFPISFVYPREGAMPLLATASVVKGAPNAKLAQRFIDFLLEPETERTLATSVFFGPTNTRTTLPAEASREVVTGSAVKQLVPLNWHVINQNRAAWTDRWNREVESH